MKKIMLISILLFLISIETALADRPTTGPGSYFITFTGAKATITLTTTDLNQAVFGPCELNVQDFLRINPDNKQFWHITVRDCPVKLWFNKVNYEGMASGFYISPSSHVPGTEPSIGPSEGVFDGWGFDSGGNKYKLQTKVIVNANGKIEHYEINLF